MEGGKIYRSTMCWEELGRNVVIMAMVEVQGGGDGGGYGGVVM